MGIFLKITYESRYPENFENQVKQVKVLDYITNNLGNKIWQEAISNQLQKIDKHHTSLFIILRLFHLEDIEKGNLKSIYRYINKKDELIIDQMFALDNFIALSEDEMRIKICDELFEYVEKVLIKYKDRFQDFDAIAFIPLLKGRIEKIKHSEFEDNFHETEHFAMMKQAEEIKKSIRQRKNG